MTQTGRANRDTAAPGRRWLELQWRPTHCGWGGGSMYWKGVGTELIAPEERLPTEDAEGQQGASCVLKRKLQLPPACTQKYLVSDSSDLLCRYVLLLE